MAQGSETNNALQYDFLSKLAENQTRTVIFLIGGVRLRGIVIDFDLYSITFALGESVQLIYKHSIATVSPWNPIHGPWDNKRSDDFKR